MTPVNVACYIVQCQREGSWYGWLILASLLPRRVARYQPDDVTMATGDKPGDWEQCRPVQRQTAVTAYL